MKTIAVIDDDIHIGDMLTEVLTQEGYAVLRAYSGTEALYLLSHNKPDLVLLNLMLPGLSGEEVLPHIENSPVIILKLTKNIYRVTIGDDSEFKISAIQKKTQEILHTLGIDLLRKK